MTDEIEETIPVFEPYGLEIGAATYTVLEPEEAVAQRVQTPQGQVIGVPVADSSIALTAEALQAHLDNPPAQPTPVRMLSKLTIRRYFRELGKEAAFDSALDQIPNARADWTDCNEVRTDDAMFTTHRAALQAALSLTDAQLQTLLI